MKILVTGANGLLGQKLTEILLGQPTVELVATGRGVSRNRHLQAAQYRQLDVTKQEDVFKVMKNIRPDVVIHTAAMTNVDDCELDQQACVVNNIDAVKNVIAGCQAVKARLIHLSTDFIFNGDDGPLTEDAVADPVNFYGQSKLEAEQRIMASDLDWAIARTVLVYGVVEGLSRSNIILWVKENLENKKVINVVDDQWRTPTLAEDLAQGCWLLAKNNAQGIYNISGKDMLTPYDMAHLVAEYFNLDKNLINRANASNFSQPARRPARTGFILDKAINDLGYQPHSFLEGIGIIANQINKTAL